MAKTTKSKKLTPHRERFCQAYNILPKANKAYFKVYKCSKATAETNGPALLRNTQVKARIKELQAKVEAKSGKKAEDVVLELVKIGFSNVKTMITDNNQIEDISKLPDEVTAAIESIQTDIRHDGGDSDGYTEKVKLNLHSKISALDKLGKHFGIFEKDNKQKNELLSTVLDRINGSTAGKLPSQDRKDSSGAS